MAGKITRIEELEALYYGHNRNLLRKADAPILTSTTGVFNAIYGAYAWAQLNLEANAFGILPKYPWDKSGWRIITARATLAAVGGSTLGGTVEGGIIQDTVKPTLEEIDLRPKTAQLPFSASEVMEWLATHSRDDIWGGLGSLRLYMAVQHKENLNRMLLADVENGATTTGGTRASPYNDWETLDRIVSAKAEADYYDTVLAGTDWADPWFKVDRDAVTTYDSTVDSASGTIGTNGVLTDDTIRSFLRKIRIAAGKDPNVFLGSHEVYSEIQGLYMPSVRIGNPYGEALVQIDVNGIQTFKGTGVGIHVDAIYGVPFIPTKDAPKNSADTVELGRLFALDTSDAEGYGYPRIGIQIAIPTEYYEATRRTPGYPFINDAFTEKGVFRTMGETVCRHFKSQGKIRDIKL